MTFLTPLTISNYFYKFHSFSSISNLVIFQRIKNFKKKYQINILRMCFPLIFEISKKKKTENYFFFL
jgi:hypothetical protein